MANQSVVLKLKTGEVDNWGKEEYEKISIEHCVVQPQTIYSGSNNNRQIVANAIVFFYAKITNPMPVLNPKHVGSTLNFEGKDYSITQITDNRGTLEGWTLSAKQNSAFTSATKGQTLEGTEIVFQNASAVTAGQSAAPTSLASVTFGTVGESHNVMVAATDQGAGKWSYLYGNASSIAEVDGRQVMKDVQLKVPGKSVKLNDAYKTTITWTLANTPV